MSERTEADTVAVEVREAIAWVKFNRPEKRNSMSPKLNRQMLRVLNDLEFRDDVGVLVLTGAGTAWSAGMDLKEYFRETEAQGLKGVRHSQREAYAWWERLRWYQKVTIAMVNGWCFGAAYGPLFACDLAFCAEDAEFGLSEINWGILPGGGAGKVAADLMPMRKAMYHALLGEKLRQAGRGGGARQRSASRGPSAGAGGRGGKEAIGQELGDAQGHQGRYAARARDDLRQRGGLPHPRPGGAQLARQVRRAAPRHEAVSRRQELQARTQRVRQVEVRARRASVGGRLSQRRVP